MTYSPMQEALLLRIPEAIHYSQILHAISPKMEVRKFLENGIKELEGDRSDCARMTLILAIAAWQLDQNSLPGVIKQESAHVSSSFAQTLRTCFFSQAWFFKLTYLLKKQELLNTAELADTREISQNILKCGERDANNRSFLFALGHIYAALCFPDIPEASVWKAYANAVFDDWFIGGDCFEPGYVAHNLSKVIELGLLLGRESDLKSKRAAMIFQRYLDHVSPSGLVIAPGDGDDQSSYVDGLSAIYELTLNPDYRWAVHMTKSAGEYGAYREKKGTRLIPPKQASAMEVPPMGSVTKIQHLYPCDEQIPDRLLLCPSRREGSPYCGMMLNDRYETLHHISAECRGELYHYEADGVLYLKRSSWQKQAEQCNMFIVRDASLEYPFSYGRGLEKERWYHASADIRLMAHFMPDKRFKGVRQSVGMPHTGKHYADSNIVPRPLEYIDQQSPLGVFLSNPNGIRGHNDDLCLKSIGLSFYTFPVDFWNNPNYDQFQRAIEWSRDEHRELAYSETEIDVQIRKMALCGEAGSHTLSLLNDCRLIYYPLSGGKQELSREQAAKLVQTTMENDEAILSLHCPFGRLDLVFDQVDLAFNLTKDYSRLDFDYRYLSDVRTYLRTPIGVMINEYTCRSLHVDFQQGGTLIHSYAQQRGMDSYGEATYRGIYAAGSQWTRQTLLTAEGILIVIDRIHPSEQQEGMAGGPVWQLQGITDAGIQWADSGIIENKKLLVYFHPQRGHEYGMQRQPKLWYNQETAFYERAVFEKNRQEWFVTVLLPHDAFISAKDICHKHNTGGKLMPDRQTKNFQGVRPPENECIQGIYTEADADMAQIWIALQDVHFGACINKDGGWSITRSAEMEGQHGCCETE